MPDEISNGSFDERWLRITRIAALGPILLAIGYSLWSRSPVLRRGCSEDRSFASWLLWLISFTAIFSLNNLLKKTAPKHKKGLAWAVVAGGFWGIAGLALVAVQLSNRSYRDSVLPLLSSAAQISLAGCAIKTYYSKIREKGDFAILRKRAGLLAGYLVLCAVIVIALPDFWATTRNGYANSAADALRKIKTAEDAYAQKYGKGFSPSLAALGPASRGAGPSESAAALVALELARGSSGEYVIKYIPGTPGADGKIATYTLSAQPIELECTRWKRFFADQSGTIHVNADGQPALASDPPLL